MSDKENNDEKDKQNLIGVDPLAWLSDEEKQSILDGQKKIDEDRNDHESSQDEPTYTINLNAALTIRDVSELMEKLNQIDDAHNEVIIESEEVERVDTAALQLLLGFYLFAKNKGKKVIWNKPSQTLCHAVEILGLKEVIDIHSVTVC